MDIEAVGSFLGLAPVVCVLYLAYMKGREYWRVIRIYEKQRELLLSKLLNEGQLKLEDNQPFWWLSNKQPLITWQEDEITRRS